MIVSVDDDDVKWLVAKLRLNIEEHTMRMLIMSKVKAYTHAFHDVFDRIETTRKTRLISRKQGRFHQNGEWMV